MGNRLSIRIARGLNPLHSLSRSEDFEALQSLIWEMKLEAECHILDSLTAELYENKKMLQVSRLASFDGKKSYIAVLTQNLIDLILRECEGTIPVRDKFRRC